MPSILHVSQPTDGGVAQCVADFARFGIELGLRVSVACPPDGPLARWVETAGGIYVPWPATRNPGMSVGAQIWRLRQIVQKVDPDVVHLHSSKAGLAGRLALRGKRPTIFQPHSWSFQALSGLPQEAAALWERFGAHWAQVIICVSEEELRCGQARGIRASWRVVENGVDPTGWSEASQKEALEARLRLGLLSGPVVVSVGRLTRQKGQDILIEAWREVREEVPAAVLILVGDGPERLAIAQQCCPGAKLVGRREDVKDWLAAADVVVIPSRWEGLSLLMLEAMARGRSVVATDVGSAREVLSEGAGTVVAVEDRVGLAQELVKRLRDPRLRAQEGKAGRRRVEEHYGLARTATSLADVYKAVLGTF